MIKKIISLFAIISVIIFSCDTNNTQKSTTPNDCKECKAHYYNLDSIPFHCYECVNSLTLAMKEYQSIPDEVFKMRNIKYLDLKMNEIQDISLKIRNLKELITLELGDNNINSIPCFISDMPNLKHLEVSGNNIKKLNDCLCDSSSLEHINLILNPIELPSPCFNKFVVRTNLN